MRFEHHQNLTDEQYTEAARVHVANITEEAKGSEQARREYGRWMITSLVVAHSAALAALARFGGDDARELLSGAGWLFVLGVITAFLSGLAASLYFAMHTRRLYYLGDPSLIYDRSFKPAVPKGLRRGILIVYIVSVTSGLTSTALLFAGANAVRQVFAGS